MTANDARTNPSGPPPPFDAACQALLSAVPEMPRITDEVRVLARQQADLLPLDALSIGGAFEVTERQLGQVRLVVALPANHTTPPAVIYLAHHGGMIMGGPREAALPVLTHLALPLGLAVVSVGYRLAPDVQAPALTEDCYAGLCWLAENADSIGVDSQRIVLMGISGGGGLAAACALMARDLRGPAVRAQLLMYPMLDDRNNSASSKQMAGVGIWRHDDNAYAWKQVLGERCGTAGVSEYEAPARATFLGDLPPTYLDAGSAETFRDEVVDFARGIWLAGGVADLHVWAGGFHGFDLLAPESPLGAASWQTKREWLRRQLG